MTPRPARPTVVDLYSGAGGMSLGMEQAGFDVLAGVEIDPVHAAVHKFNFPLTEIVCTDLSTVSSQDLLGSARRGWELHHPGVSFPGSIDVIVGGPPCQGFSVGGVREENDLRNDQIAEFARLVAAVKPRAFCLENVAGLLEPTFAEIRESALSQLVAAGYVITGSTSWVNAKSFGVPQSRKRVLILGALGGAAPPSLVGSAPEVSVGDAFAGLPDLAMYRRLLFDDEATWRAHSRITDADRLGPYAAQLAGLLADPEDFAHPRSWDPDLITSSRRTVHSPRTVQRFARTRQGASEPVSRLFRLDPEGVARTLRAGTGSDRGSHTSPRPIHPLKNRVITVREAARLHGYPDWFRFHTTNWHGHREVGNSVPPPLARAAGRALLAALGLRPAASPGAISLGDPELLRLSPSQAKVRLALESPSPVCETGVA